MQRDQPEPLTIGPLRCEWGRRTYVMGIINVTEDSFSGDGLLQRDDMVAAAVAQARQFVAWGADLLDVGGESTRPGAEPVDAETEQQRVVPIIQQLAAEFGTQVAISVDTSKASVAAAAVAAGAHLVNDVWGLRLDPEMVPTVAAAGVPVVVMHNRMRPEHVVREARIGPYLKGVQYDDLLGDICQELSESVALARAAGIPETKIIVDPGIGFGKTLPQNLELLNRVAEVRAVLGRPLLLGTSRKSFIGLTLDLPPDERVEGTAATVAVGIVRGADIVRVHDVREMVRVARMTDAIVRPHENK
jgi:dihydropteroate synthase